MSMAAAFRVVDITAFIILGAELLDCNVMSALNFVKSSIANSVI